MFQEKSLTELGQIFQFLKTKLEEFDDCAIRDKKSDYSLLPENKLNFVLKSNIKQVDKKRVLLTQIGYVRINLFMEYLERMMTLANNKDYDRAVQLMNDYSANVSIPFISPARQPSLIDRFVALFSPQRTLAPSEHIRKWRTDYESWVRKRAAKHIRCSAVERSEDFINLQVTFNMLYNLSFSDDNFPPAPTIIYYDPTKPKSVR